MHKKLVGQGLQCGAVRVSPEARPWCLHAQWPWPDRIPLWQVCLRQRGLTVSHCLTGDCRWLVAVWQLGV